MKRLINTCAGIAAVAIATSISSHAQEIGSSEYEQADALNVAVAVRGGITLAMPRGTFPSLIITPSKGSSGAIAESHGSPAMAGRIDVNVLIPITESFGVTLGAGSQAMAVDFTADSARLPSHFVVQTLQGLLGVQWSVINEKSSYRSGGLRSLYLDGGLDIGLATMANRIESSMVADTLDAEPQPATGSFESSEPFRNVIALRGAVGLRFALAPNFELSAEASYSYALNRLFSSETIENNDFAMDVVSAVVGVGYRF
ncbi:MAG: hypothetical protein H7X80_11795 [bacterium]|nr:hypothetical protein [Candidatus Kapabacteria bacterium]